MDSSSSAVGPARLPAGEYTLPGVMHFLQQEWRRFETDRNAWSVERVQLTDRLATLEGERRSFETVKSDLLRRIKMLEFALRQERSKRANGTDGDGAAPATSAGAGELPNRAATMAARYGVPSSGPAFPFHATDDLPARASAAADAPEPVGAASGSKLRAHTIATGRSLRGRQILQQYLDQIGQSHELLVDLRQKRSIDAAGAALLTSLFAPTPPSLPATAADAAPTTGGAAPASAASAGPTTAPSDAATGAPASPAERPTAASLREMTLMTTVAPGHHTPASPHLVTEVSAALKEHHPLPLAAPSDSPDPPPASAVAVLPEPEDEPAPADPVPSDSDTVRLPRSYVASASAALGSAPATAAVAPVPAEPNTATEDQSDTARVPPTQADKQALEAMGISSAKLSKLMRGWEDPKKKSKRKPGSDLSHLFEGSKAADAGAASAVGKAGAAAAAASTAKKPDELASLAGEDDFDFGTTAEVRGLFGTKEVTQASTERLPSAKQWKLGLSARGHFDAVRAVAFAESDPIVLSASDDGTVKMWNLTSLVTKHRVGSGFSPRTSASGDLEPTRTFRGHTGPVFALAVARTSQALPSGAVPVFSGGQDEVLRMWALPAATADPYFSVGPAALSVPFEGHRDCIWDVQVHPSKPLVATASADRTVKIWSFDGAARSARTTLRTADDDVAATSIAFLPTDPSKILVTYADSAARVFDIETGQNVTNFASAETYDGTSATQINKAVVHPTLALAVTAHEDKYLRFFDTATGARVHSMVAHQDAVATAAMHPDGQTVVTGGHDSSMRAWDVRTFACVQEAPTHRPKYNEAVLGLVINSSGTLLASGGGDATLRVFL